MRENCAHCGKPIIYGVEYCCRGCAMAAAILNHASISEHEPKPTGKFSAFAHIDEDNGEYSLLLAVEGIHCASCIQLIENALLAEDSVTYARVNMSTKRLHFRWRGDIVEGDRLASKVEELGYKLTAFDPNKVAAGEYKEEKFLLRCIAVSGFAMGNIMLLSVALWSSSSEIMGIATRDLMHWVSAIIALPAIAYAGRPFFLSALSVLRQGHTNMDVPISLAVILASGMSLWEVMRHGEHAYFDSAVMLLFFLLIGRYLDARAKGKARESAQELLAMLEGTATVIEGSSTRQIPIKELRPAMRVRVAVGEKIPVDSVVIEGESELDTSIITGETVPRLVKKSDYVFAGTINLSAPLLIEVAKASENSLLSDIVKLMEQAEQGQARYVRLADRAAKLYTPIVHSLGLITFLGWWLGMGIAWQESLMIAVTVLIITCPCALGLAVPVVQVLASGKLMRNAILLKSGDALEKLASINHVIFDKTGTLTIGKPFLQGRYSNLQLAASLAVHSKHPYSQAIYNAYKGEILSVEDVQEVVGKGVQAMYDGKIVRLGKRDWCLELLQQEVAANNHENKIAIAGDTELSIDYESNEETDKIIFTAQIWLVQSGAEPIIFYLHDPLREDAKQVIANFTDNGISTEILSGDREDMVHYVAQQLNIDKWRAELSPVDKTKIIKQYEQQDYRVMMVGDGLNDAPSLVSATVSMSPSSAMDITQNAADIVFQGEKLQPVIIAWQVARKANILVKQNFMLAVIYNIIAIPMAVMGYVTPLIAAIAMSGSSLIVIGNSFRINWEQR